jgi:putative oxidoreductase
MSRSSITVALPPDVAPRLSRVQRRRLGRAARQRLNRGALPLLARICLVVLYPLSAYDKVAHWDHALKQADSSIVPKAAGPAMLIAAMAVEVLAPLCIVTGRHDRLAASILAGYCVATAGLYQRFWEYPNFWSPSSGEGNEHFWAFFKNFGLLGGVLLLLAGGKPVPFSEVIEHPLGSAPMSA